ncbi:MAG TPA: Ppx/GppA family phosphatase, partial [Anaeromyxobacteraceae bacterium]|nr:Ppx/GppA family phosphatase [Anaeromyxobacteraceae bacterium]
MTRHATIDVGTNTVLLLVAEERVLRLRPAGPAYAQDERIWVPVVERAEITRLGRGVDRTGALDAAAVAETVAVLARFADEARRLGARDIACVATSAARDARNGADFFEAARARAGLTAEVISGDEEARLVWASAWRDFGAAGPGGLAVLDPGGGSTELCCGDGPAPRARRSFQVGAVRLTERVAPPDPPGVDGLAALRAAAAAALA